MNIIKIKRPKSGHWRRVKDPFYQSKMWKSFRESYLREHPNCILCEKEGVSKMAVVLDHIKQRSLGGADFDTSNVRGLCIHHDAVNQAEQSKRSR